LEVQLAALKDAP